MSGPVRFTDADLRLVNAIVANLWRTSSVCAGFHYRHKEEAVSRVLLAFVERNTPIEKFGGWVKASARNIISRLRDEEEREQRTQLQCAITLGVQYELHDDVGHIEDEARAPYSEAEVRRAIESTNTMREAAAKLGIVRSHLYRLIKHHGIRMPPRPRSRKVLHVA